MFRPSLRLAALCAAVALVSSACNSSESTSPSAHGDPVAARLYANGAEITPTVALTGGQTLRVEVRLYDDQDKLITGLDTGHLSAITFSPGGLATVTAVAGQPFQWDITADSAGGTGTLSVGYGHQVADEKIFGPFSVNAAAATIPIALQFMPMVGAQGFACGQTYTGIGTANATMTPIDFRMYVHDVRLVRADSSEAPVALTQDGLWQYQDLALLDFEDGTGNCNNGTPETHMVVSGTADYGQYIGVKFKLGVPFALNHGDPTTAPSPLNLTGLFWSWNGGYKFLRLDNAVDSAGTMVGRNLHLGSTGCNGSTATTPPTSCTAENVTEITLLGFNPRTGHVMADAKAVFAGSDLAGEGGGAPGCMSGTTDPECTPIFARLGLPFGGNPAGVQALFSGMP